MGKTSWWNKDKGSKWEQQSSASWQQWQPPQGTGTTSQPTVWDGYKSVQLEQGHDQNKIAGDVEKMETPNLSMAQIVQKQVNLARKADQKHKRAQQDLRQCQMKWTKYQDQLRALYNQQHEAFLKDVDSLEAEVARTQDAAEVAAIKLRHVLENDGNARENLAPMEVSAIGELDPWEELVHGSEKDGPAISDLQIAAALQNMNRSGSVAKPGDNGRMEHAAADLGLRVPPTPQVRPAGGLPLTPATGKGGAKTGAVAKAATAAMQPFYNAGARHAQLDPYQSSPSGLMARVEADLVQNMGTPPRTTMTRTPLSRTGKPRVPIKEVGKCPLPKPAMPSKAITDQLQAKREAAMSELAASHGGEMHQHIPIADDDEGLEVVTGPDGGRMSLQALE